MPESSDKAGQKEGTIQEAAQAKPHWLDDNVKEKLCGMLKLIKENFPLISPVVAILFPVLGLSPLLIFSKFIGRPDVFIPSLEFGLELVFVFLFSLFGFSIFSVILLIFPYFLISEMRFSKDDAVCNKGVVIRKGSVVIIGEAAGGVVLGFTDFSGICFRVF